MAENKGKGTKGRNYDELTGVGTSSAGITGTTGNLNTGTRDGGIGMPSSSDSGNRAGNRQSAELDDADDGDTTPALGRGTRSNRGRQQGSQDNQSRQGGSQSGNKQSGSGSGNAQGGLGHSLDQDVMGKEQ
ncbi:hypothetical protein [Massilia sp. Mn16-1_5]|uniref:hypothetical protein n=1 Tax=Massilia sp. Mn16-1_5 TaxID=2079199 RepID=UPI00109ED98B|nr:hypothetical protein [Massilia sp. Mn16-1_5]THC45382.1 hypothetical protein C2862_06305 [Massilia sp. Mn16-1_5]